MEFKLTRDPEPIMAEMLGETVKKIVEISEVPGSDDLKKLKDIERAARKFVFLYQCSNLRLPLEFHRAAINLGRAIEPNGEWWDQQLQDAIRPS